VDKPSLLIVEDDEGLLAQYRYALRDDYVLSCAAKRPQAVKLFTELKPELVSLDLGLPPRTDSAEEGLATLEDLLRIDPCTRVIVVTGNGDKQNALRALQLGAFDYQLKPVDIDDLKVMLRRAAYLRGLEAEGRAQEAAVAARFEDILGTTPKMLEIFKMLTQVAKTEATVLLQGESGTGKELAARAIHARSNRRQGPFVAINCGAIPETLLESELFGSEKGAYTGAHAQRKGKLELAQGGSLFLDEIAEMSLGLQVKLLRFLQERRLERVGGREQIAVDTRVIAASNKDLKSEIQAGRFREDVYYRVSVVVITMPPLRERDEDVVLLANAFLRKSCQEHRRNVRFSARSLEAVARYSWPGNIRELQNAVQRSVIMAQGRFIEPSDLTLAEAPTAPLSRLREARSETERRVLIDALIRSQGNISKAAKDLGVSRPAIHDLLDKHQVTAKQFR
jgi:two-component system, NtrC family, response regulator